MPAFLSQRSTRTYPFDIRGWQKPNLQEAKHELQTLLNNSEVDLADGVIARACLPLAFSISPFIDTRYPEISGDVVRLEGGKVAILLCRPPGSSASVMVFKKGNVRKSAMRQVVRRVTAEVRSSCAAQ
ncbi:hypothetical protein K8R03_02510 [Candidatus Kaiserbacteria bacterium]|nr:hypothetical protein [Candidatus Kaiserbacteria bacterium]